MFAECMGHNFVIKALFYAQCVDIFVTRFLFCESPGCYVTKNPNKNAFYRVTWSRVQRRRVRVHCFYVNKDVRESSVSRAVAGQIGTKYGARGAAEMIDRWCDGLNWSGMELFPIWRRTFAPESVRVRHTSLKCFNGRQHQQEKSGERFGFLVFKPRERKVWTKRVRGLCPIRKHWLTLFHLTWTMKVSRFWISFEQ